MEPEGGRRIRIIVADDNLLILVLLQRLLDQEFDVVAAVSDGKTLIEAAFRLRPDVIVTDISMPQMSGIEAVEQIRRALPEIRCIFITMHGGESYRREARRVGASGYVLKSVVRQELRQAIHRAVELPV
jgi:DNA-binding NarL/FixJ family response regulator